MPKVGILLLPGSFKFESKARSIAVFLSFATVNGEGFTPPKFARVEMRYRGSLKYGRSSLFWGIWIGMWAFGDFAATAQLVEKQTHSVDYTTSFRNVWSWSWHCCTFHVFIFHSFWMWESLALHEFAAGLVQPHRRRWHLLVTLIDVHHSWYEVLQPAFKLFMSILTGPSENTATPVQHWKNWQSLGLS